MTKMRWPAPRNPRPRAAARVAEQILEADRSRRSARHETAQDDRRVLAAMPGDGASLSRATDIPIDRVGAALSRLKAASRAKKVGKRWEAM